MIRYDTTDSLDRVLFWFEDEAASALLAESLLPRRRLVESSQMEQRLRFASYFLVVKCG